jgi:transcriptional regulator of acetoin/glycerol metabolism
VDFRLVCATHRNLRREIEAGRFREDLYYRLNGLALQLPALHERQDMPHLVAQMLHGIEPGRELRLAPDLALAMSRYRWPGNLRQLNSALHTACALLGEHEAQIDWWHLPDDLADELRGISAPEPAVSTASALSPGGAADLKAVSARAVSQAMQSCAGNLSEAARRLGISRNTLYRKLRQLPPG